MRLYVTFEKRHIHELGHNLYDNRCVAVIHEESAEKCLTKMRARFGKQIGAYYLEHNWDPMRHLPFHPRGYIYCE